MKLNFNIWGTIGLIVLLLLGFVFFKIVIYLGISIVLFLVGYPVTYRLEKIKIGKFRIPNALAALLTIVFLVGVVLGLFFIILPPLIAEIGYLSDLNFFDVMHNILNQYPSLKSTLHRFGNEEELERSISTQLNKYVNANNVSEILNHALGYFGSTLGGTLCVLFITFFLLKDEKIVKESIMVIWPSGKEKEAGEIIRTSKRMLSKYFAGLFLDMLIVGLSALMVLWMMGIKNALIIAFCAGVLNIIPYIGSVITMSVAIILGVSSCISTGSYELIAPTIDKIFFGLLTINLLDAFILQPLIFSNSVRAHPLEIFIVTLMAGAIGGIFGMVIALPTYTLIRIIAKEFLTHLKFFKKISDTISE